MVQNRTKIVLLVGSFSILQKSFVVHDGVAIASIRVQFKNVFLAAVLHQLVNDWLDVFDAREVRQFIVVNKLEEQIISKT